MTPDGRKPWPANAVPETWIDALFEKMAATYGARFADLWRGLDFDAIRREWGIETRKLSREQFAAGVHTLAAGCVDAPTLPRFMAHCRAARREAVNAAFLTDNRRADPTKYAANMSRVREAAKPRVAGGVAWAWALLKRGKGASGQALTPEIIRVAEGAIANFAQRGKGEKNDD
jgi:hypothetical protein